MGKPLSDRPPWEKALVDKIRLLSATEKSLVLEVICHHLREQNQVGPWVTPVLQGSLRAGAHATPWLPVASAWPAGMCVEGQVGSVYPTTCCPEPPSAPINQA